MEVLTTHKYVATPAEAVAATIRAGMDTDDGVDRNKRHAKEHIGFPNHTFWGPLCGALWPGTIGVSDSWGQARG